MAEALQQGEVWDVDFGEVNEETARPEPRPATIVSRNQLNKGEQILVVPLTSRRVEERKQYPNNVFFPSGVAGLTEDSVAQTHLVAPVERPYFVRRRGKLSLEQLAVVLQALLWTVDYFDDTGG